MSGIIQCSCLGRFGRFGNQLFQYAFARAYAEYHECILETPPWVGQRLFKNVADPPLSRRLPRTGMDQIPHGKTNIDLFGYFQNEGCLAYYSAEKVRQFFNFKDQWTRRFPKRYAYVAAHIRRGDYTFNSHLYCLVSEESYLRAIDAFGANLSVVWVSEEKPKKVSHMEEELAFLPDFFTLLNARVLLRSNSTFSWWAATLGNATVYSPLVGNSVGMQTVEFVPGNWPKLVNAPHHTDLQLRSEEHQEAAAS